jgi:hypothetical protein
MDASIYLHSNLFKSCLLFILFYSILFFSSLLLLAIAVAAGGGGGGSVNGLVRSDSNYMIMI